jgi:hypothetical protein
MATGTTSQPPPPPKKSNTMLWVLVGVGGFFLLIALIVVGGIAYIARNPALLVTKMIHASNPNLDVVSVDKGSRLITVHNKETGETFTLTLDDVKNGKLTMKSSNGQATFNAGGSAKLPAWVPNYPGSDPQSSFSAEGQGGESGTFTFKTGDSTEHVTRFYQDHLQSAGLHVTVPVPHMLVAQDDAKRRTMTIVIAGEGRDTMVQATFATKK